MASTGDFADIPTRPMRVKILYTFDSESKTTCLARLPSTLNIPAVAIDEQSQVGVIDLQQCIDAMVSASPEIMSQLENGDFSVYSYDYSEYDAPVVGQGRMSSLLGNSMPAVEDSKTMITGRVCKNIAIFNNGVKETLEVKFKLTPLARPSRAPNNIDTFRSASPATSAGFDPNAWNTSMQSKPQQQSNEYFDFGMASMGEGSDTASLEELFGMATEGSGEATAQQQRASVGVSQTPTDSAFASYNPAFLTHSHSAPGSRAGSPMVVSSSSSRSELLRHQSFSGNAPSLTDQTRPDSRGSVRSESFSSHMQQQPLQAFEQQNAQQETESFYNEDGQSRKRAKVVQADWRGKSSFGSKSADLRVTAAKSSSMQMFRPVAKRPTAPGTNLEPPPRAPTPVPQRTRPVQPRLQSAVGRSSLRQASVADSDAMSDVDLMSDVMTSPEGSSPGNSMNGDGTPMDIPSSPPIVPGYNHPQPSSPGLPTMASHMADSGYMSGGFRSGTIMESMEDDADRSPDAEYAQMARRYQSSKGPQSTLVKSEGSPIEATPAPYSDMHFSSDVPEVEAGTRGRSHGYVGP